MRTRTISHILLLAGILGGLVLASQSQADLIYDLCVQDEGETRGAYCQCNEDYLKQNFTDEEYAFFLDMTEIQAEGGSQVEASMLISGYDWDVLEYENFRDKATRVMDEAEESCE